MNDGIDELSESAKGIINTAYTFYKEQMAVNADEERLFASAFLFGMRFGMGVSGLKGSMMADVCKQMFGITFVNQEGECVTNCVKHHNVKNDETPS